MRQLKRWVVGLLAVAAWTGGVARAEVECKGWGVLRGFRFQGELLEFTSQLRMVPVAGQGVGLTNQSRTQAGRVGTQQTFSGALALAAGGGANYRMQVDDTAGDVSAFDIQATANGVQQVDGVYYDLIFPQGIFNGGTAEVVNAAGEAQKVALSGMPQGAANYLQASVKSVKLTQGHTTVELNFAVPTDIALSESRGGRGQVGGLTLTVAVGKGDFAKPFHAAFTMKVAKDVDASPVAVSLDASKTGPSFVGIGGNFRLQSQQDAAHIAYNLENLRVAWGRVAMPLNLWQTDATMDASTARLNPQVRQAMEMAQTLAKKKIPFIISDWSAPAWAVQPGGAGPGGNGAQSIAPAMWPVMYKGIVSYLVYLKQNYQAEPDLFSFNEADQGINVKLSPQEHDAVIKELGAAMAAAGLKTKMLLGDTGNPTPRPRNFAEIAASDAQAAKYIGAVSYHTWTGGSDQQLVYWKTMAQKLNVPLIIGEGGTDPDSWRFTAMLQEQWYALDEINMYVRTMALSQPASILHWQLTENYSVLSGGRGGAALKPTQRFFNLKQMNLTPVEAPAIAATADKPRLTVAAYGDAAHGWAIHLVNTGATREVTVQSLPAGVKELEVYTTDAKRNMVKGDQVVAVKEGSVIVKVEKMSFVTLTPK